jgi:hypothetical protein
VRRQLFNFAATAASLVLGVASVALWARSYQVYDYVEWSWPTRGEFGHRTRAGLITGQGGIGVFSQRSPSDPDDPRSGLRFRHESDAHHLQELSYPQTAHYLNRVMDMKHWWSRLGFVHESYGRRRLAGVPFWFLTALTAVPPTWSLARAARRRRDRTKGRCPACGYDLRATPDRCPECGAVPAGRPI